MCNGGYQSELIAEYIKPNGVKMSEAMQTIDMLAGQKTGLEHIALFII